MSQYGKLTRLQRKFVDAYVQLGQNTKAMRASGWTGKNPDVQAHKWRQLPQVQAAIAERTAEAIAAAGVRSVRVLEEVARIAMFDPGKLRDEHGKMVPMHLLPEEVRVAIASEDLDKDGNTVKYRTNPKLDALKLLAQHLSLVVDRHEHTGKDGAPLVVPGNNPDLEVARRIAFLLDAGLRSTPTPLLDQESVPESGGSDDS